MGAPGEPRLPGGKPAVSRRGSFWSRLFPGRSKPKVPLEEETPYVEQSVVGRAKQQVQVKRSRSLLTQLAENSGMGRRQDPAFELLSKGCLFLGVLCLPRDFQPCLGFFGQFLKVSIASFSDCFSTGVETWVHVLCPCWFVLPRLRESCSRLGWCSWSDSQQDLYSHSARNHAELQNHAGLQNV